MRVGCDFNEYGEKWGYDYNENYDYKKQFRIGWFYIMWGIDKAEQKAIEELCKEIEEDT